MDRRIDACRSVFFLFFTSLFILFIYFIPFFTFFPFFPASFFLNKPAAPPGEAHTAAARSSKMLRGEGAAVGETRHQVKATSQLRKPSAARKLDTSRRFTHW